MRPEQMPIAAATPSIDDVAFGQILAKPSVAKEFFLPLGVAHWERGQYTLGSADRKTVTPTISGVRFQEPDLNNLDVQREKGCQQDLAALVRSLAELRKCPNLPNLVLSTESVVGKQAGNPACRRALFGLCCPSDGRFRGEPEAVAECQRQILRTAAKAGFVLCENGAFEPSCGFRGLAEWAGAVRWQARRQPPWWMLLIALPLLLLLLFVPWSCSKNPAIGGITPTGTIVGIQLETSSFIIVLDKSGSMQPYFKQVQVEAKRLLNDTIKNSKGAVFVDLIVYDAHATSVLGKLESLTDANAGRLTGYLEALQPGGGTDLEKALEIAAREVAHHQKKTTLLILTDGEDATLQRMSADKDRILQMFGPTEVIMRCTTPRLFNGGDPTPINAAEKALATFATTMGGQFGPNRGSP